MLRSSSDGFAGVVDLLDGVDRGVVVVDPSLLSRLDVGVRVVGTDVFRFVIADTGRVGVVFVFGVKVDFDGTDVVRGGGAEFRPVGVFGNEPVDAASISCSNLTKSGSGPL